MTERENALLALNHKEPMWVPSLWDCSIFCPDFINERPIFETGYDSFGVHWVSSGKETGGITHVDPHMAPVLDDITEWRGKVKFPDLDAIDWDAAEKVASEFDRENKLVMYMANLGVFERTHVLMSFEEALCAYMEEPEEMKGLIEAIADHKIKVFELMHKHCKLDLIMYHDDWGIQTGPILPKATWEEIIRPSTKRIFDKARSLGLYITHHSCGKIESYIPDMIEMGAHGWASCQSCNDLGKIKKEYGDKIVFMGALDDQNVLGHPNTTNEDLAAEARRKVEMLSEGGGWIAGPAAYVSFNFSHDRACEGIIKKMTMRSEG